MENIKELLPFFIPLVILQFGMQIYSIVNLVKRKKVRYLNKPLWAVIILAFGITGSSIYLLLRGYDQ